MVAGGLYGVYKFTTVREDAQKEANARLVATYKQIGEMHDQQMSQLSAMLKLNRETAADTAEKIKEAEVAKQNVNGAKAEAEQAKADANKARASAASLLEQSNETNERVNKRFKELRDKENEQARKANIFDQQVQYIKELKGQLIELARLIRSRDSSVATMAETILNEASVEAKNLLSRYAREFGKDRKKDDANANALNELVGSSAKALETALTQEKWLGFVFWQKYAKNDKAPTTYIGVVRQTTNTAEGVILISTEGPNPAEEKVSDVQVFGHLVSVAGRDPDNWNKLIAYNVYLRPTGELGIDAFTPNTDHWTIPETESDFKESDDNEAKHDTLSGSEQPMAFMSLQDFKKNAELYDAAKSSYRREFSSMIGMLENETHFDPKKIGDTAEMPAEIRDALVQLLAESHQESLKPGPIKSAKMIAPGSDLKPEVYGRIAAMALMKDFKTERTQPADSSVTSTKDQACIILCGYSTFDEAPIKRHARLTLTREGTDGKWMLLNFENPIVLSSIRAG